MNIAVVLAAGTGKRFGSLKQFALVKNRPLIYYSLIKFEQSEHVNRIIVVTIKSKLAYLKQLAKKYHLHKVTDIIEGGKERQDSVLNALKILPANGYITIHDSARPLFNTAIIRQGFINVRKHKSVITVLPIQDTVKKVKQHKIIRTIDRSNLYYVQTPQFFDVRLLKQAYQKAYRDKFYATDDAGIIEHSNYKVFAIPGNRENMKITDKQDLQLVRRLL